MRQKRVIANWGGKIEKRYVGMRMDPRSWRNLSFWRERRASNDRYWWKTQNRKMLIFGIGSTKKKWRKTSQDMFYAKTKINFSLLEVQQAFSYVVVVVLLCLPLSFSPTLGHVVRSLIRFFCGIRERMRDSSNFIKKQEDDWKDVTNCNEKEMRANGASLGRKKSLRHVVVAFSFFFLHRKSEYIRPFCHWAVTTSGF